MAGWRRAKRGSGRVHRARSQQGGWYQALCGASGREWIHVLDPAKGSKCLKCVRRQKQGDRAMKKLDGRLGC